MHHLIRYMSHPIRHTVFTQKIILIFIRKKYLFKCILILTNCLSFYFRHLTVMFVTSDKKQYNLPFATNGCVGMEVIRPTVMLFLFDSSFFIMHIGVVNLKGGFRSFSFTQQWFSVHSNHSYSTLRK